MKARKKFKASVVIPVWNEKNNIGHVLSRIPGGLEIIVVDDGSTDNTTDVVRAFGIEPLIMGKHHGKGYACLRGADAANSEFIIFMDGDGQHDPGDISKIIALLAKNDMVLGFRDYSVLPLQRRMTNTMANFAVSMISRRKFRDVQCGFRGIRKSALKKLNLDCTGYEIETDMVAAAVARNLRIAEVPIRVYYKRGESGKQIGSRIPLSSSLASARHLIKKAASHKINNIIKKKDKKQKRR
jgi:glycosyltransferase involved in cell wall biosynthesis